MNAEVAARCGDAARARSFGAVLDGTARVRDPADYRCPLSTRRQGTGPQPLRAWEMIVVKHGPREMQLAWDLPVTFAGRARMNVQMRWAEPRRRRSRPVPRCTTSGEDPRSFSTNYYLSPGRLNEVEVNGVNVIVDYCHNAPGMKTLGDFVDGVGDLMSSAHQLLGSAVSDRVIADRGRSPRRGHAPSLGHIAAQHFDVVIIREDVAGAGTAATWPGWSPRGCVPRSRRAPAASRSRRCTTRSRRSGTPWLGQLGPGGDLCGQARRGGDELENWSPQAQAGAGVSSDRRGP